jgi:hypothetical protein
MAETVQTPMDNQKPGSSSKVWLIVLVVVVVLCCALIICGGAGYWLWVNGDELFKDWLAIFSYI